MTDYALQWTIIEPTDATKHREKRYRSVSSFRSLDRCVAYCLEKQILGSRIIHRDRESVSLWELNEASRSAPKDLILATIYRRWEDNL